MIANWARIRLGVGGCDRVEEKLLSRLIIVDQSLRGMGGHHFDYVSQVAKAAAQQTLSVVIVANRKYRIQSSLDHLAQVIPHFRNTTYSKYSLLAGLRAMHRRPPLKEVPLAGSESALKATVAESEVGSDLNAERKQRGVPFRTRSTLTAMRRHLGTTLRELGGTWRRMMTQFHEATGRNRVVSDFAVDCEKLFASIGLLPSDHVFFTTISDLELAGLLVYWLGTPESYLPHWHLQFHFDAFQGRAPEYRTQYAALDPLRCLFEDIENAVPTHPIHYYATTGAIADQYQRLSNRPIRELVYPISPGFLAGTAGDSSNPGFSVVEEPRQLHIPFSDEAAHLSRCERQAVNQVQSPVVRIGKKVGADALNGPIYPPSAGQAGIPLSLGIGLSTGGSENFPQPPLWDPEAIGVPIVLAGGVRAEKGQKGVGEIWSELQRKILTPGLGFLVCQRPTNPPWYKRRFTLAKQSPEKTAHSQVQYLPHPLPAARYQELIRAAGVGLLTYDRRSYANRRAGIFGEYMAAGVPTLVPAGTWMADQLAGHQLRYQQNLLQSVQPTRCWSHADFDWSQWNVPSGNGAVTFDGREVPAYAWSPELPPEPLSERQAAATSELPMTSPPIADLLADSRETAEPSAKTRHRSFPANTYEASGQRLLSIRFHWIWPKEVGTYCRVEVLFYDRQRQVLGTETHVVGRMPESTGQAVLFRVPIGTNHFRLGLSNAYHDRSATLQRLLVDVLDPGSPVAIGSVGLAYDHVAQIPDRLLEMCRFHHHYRETASGQAREWYALHDPAATIQQLLSADQASGRWAA